MRGKHVHQAVLGILLTIGFSVCLGKEAPDPADPNRYLNAVREFADNVLLYGRDTYGPKHTPLFVDGLNVNTHEPVKWIAPNGDRWILSNLSSQQNLFRTLDGLTRITGNPKYKQAAMDAIKYAFENLRSPNGLLYWNGLASYDAMADKPCGQNTDDVKGFYPYFELMWEVNPQVTRQYIEALWAGHILDWSNLYMDRLCYNMTKPLPRPWDYEYKGGPVFFGGNGFDMIHAGSDLFYAAALLTKLSADEVPLVWGKRLAQRYIEARNPKTGISPLGFSKKLTPYTYDFPHPNFSNQAIWEYNQYYYMPTPGVIVSPITRVWLCQLLLSETLGPGGEDFRRWAHEELTAIGKMSYNKQRNVYVPISAEGTSREGYLCADDGPLGPKGSKLIAFPARPYDFLAYAAAYRITKDGFMWDMARNIAIGNKYGDIGASSTEEPQLNYDSTMPDPYGLLGFLELYRATGNPAVLRMAEHIADTMLAERFHKGFFVGGAKLVFCRFDAIDSLALLHLYAVTSGQAGIQIPQAWCGTGFFTSPYRKKEQVIDGMLYTQNEAFLPLSLQEAAAMGDFALVKSFIEEGASVDGVESTLPMTALQHASINGHGEIVEFLLAKGADINGRSGFPGATALHYAVQNNHKEVVELLIARGADLNAKIKSYPAGDTPLHSAVKAGYKDIVELLLAKGADVNAKNNNGQTPLDLALSRNRKDIVELFAALSIHMATSLGDLGKVKAFLEEGVDANAKNEDGLTPLHIVAGKSTRSFWTSLLGGHSSNLDIAELLITKGADVNAKDAQGLTPLQLAENQNNSEIAELLRKHGVKE